MKMRLSIISRTVAATLFALANLTTLASAQTTVVDFEDIALTGMNTFVNESFTSNGVQFDGQRVGDFNIYQGYIASNSTVNQDLSVSPGSRFGFPDFDLQTYTAYAPTTVADSQYGILAFNNSDAPRTAERGTIEAPNNLRFASIQVANTTYAAHSILVGDGFSDPFTNDDAFTLYIIGRRDAIAIGEIEVPLAIGRDVLDEFTTVSLESLADADEIAFSLSSTSDSMFGLNTPTFIALDNVTFTAVPEPASLSLLMIAGSLLPLRRRRS